MRDAADNAVSLEVACPYCRAARGVECSPVHRYPRVARQRGAHPERYTEAREARRRAEELRDQEQRYFNG